MVSGKNTVNRRLPPLRRLSTRDCSCSYRCGRPFTYLPCPLHLEDCHADHNGIMSLNDTSGPPSIVIKHKTLSTYYARLTTLEGYLGVPLTRPGDSGDFRAFLSGTICATHDRTAVRSFSIDPDHRLPNDPARAAAHHDCVDWIMADLKGRGKNMLVRPDVVNSDPMYPVEQG